MAIYYLRIFKDRSLFRLSFSIKRRKSNTCGQNYISISLLFQGFALNIKLLQTTPAVPYVIIYRMIETLQLQQRDSDLLLQLIETNLSVVFPSTSN